MQDLSQNIFTIIMVVLIFSVLAGIGIVYNKAVVKGEDVFNSKTTVSDVGMVDSEVMLSAEEVSDESEEPVEQRYMFSLGNYYISSSDAGNVYNGMLDTMVNSNCIKQYSYRDGVRIKEAIFDLNNSIKYKKDIDNNNRINIDEIAEGVWYRYTVGDYNNLEKKVLNRENVDNNDLMIDFMSLSVIPNENSFDIVLEDDAYCNDELCYKVSATNRNTSNAIIKLEYYINKETNQLIKVDKTYRNYIYSIEFEYTDEYLQIGEGLLEYQISE